MRIATQEGLLPGKDLAAKATAAREYGFAGIELWGSGLGDRMAEVRRATADAGVAVACICAGYRGAPLAKERKDREDAMADICALLEQAGELGAAGVIVVPIFGSPQLPDLRPYKGARALEHELLLAELPRLNEAAARAGTYVLLEPLNRYETHFLKTVEDAAAYCGKPGLEHVAVMADFFHMSIEEADIAASVAAAAPLIRHVHLADSNRQLPGHGHTDFLPGLTALAAAGYSGWLSLECGVPGDPAQLLPRCADHLMTLVSAAGR